MTSDNGNEDTPRREAMTGRADAEPVHEDAAPPGTPADPTSYDPGEAPRRSAGSRETANPARTTAGSAPGAPGDDRPSRESTRAGNQQPTRTGIDEPTRAGQREPGPHGNGDGALLPHDECDKYALRLQHAVGGFVDGPRASVEEADHVLEELTAEFTDAMARRRRTLRTTWQAAGEGDAADTEKLRLALRDYREVTERLLHL